MTTGFVQIDIDPRVECDFGVDAVFLALDIGIFDRRALDDLNVIKRSCAWACRSMPYKKMTPSGQRLEDEMSLAKRRAIPYRLCALGSRSRHLPEAALAVITGAQRGLRLSRLWKIPPVSVIIEAVDVL